MRHQTLVEAVAGKFNGAKGKAGRDQLTRMLNEDGINVSQPTVGAIMREQGLRAVRTRAWKKTTEQDPQAKTAHIENHMLDENGKRDFSSEMPGTRLCGDITYLKTGEGWLYLATVIDLCTGMVIGWNMDRHMRTELCTGALGHGPRSRLPACGRGGLPFRPRRPARYTSAEFQGWCAGNNVIQSMGKAGVCWDNAVAENFFSHLKAEFYHHHSFTSRLAARTSVMDYIESWYNRKRPNARAGHRPPAAALAATRPAIRKPWPRNRNTTMKLSQKLDVRSSATPMISKLCGRETSSLSARAPNASAAICVTDLVVAEWRPPCQPDDERPAETRRRGVFVPARRHRNRRRHPQITRRLTPSRWSAGSIGNTPVTKG